MADVRRFVVALVDADCRTTGRWSSGQIFHHLAGAFELSAQPPPSGSKAPRRRLINPARFFVLRGWLPRGVPIPKPVRDALTPPDQCDHREQRDRLLRSLDIFANAGNSLPPHPVIGPLSRDEWTAFHRRHCELHLGHVQINT